MPAAAWSRHTKSRELKKRVCAIDGAVLIDTSGTCHSIGVILDGLAASTGDSSRGARYNSAVRFARSTKTPCLLAVVSEDGGTDLLSSTAGQ
jgi:DNA integrity scanning protein DisA with diadenylate cyclase activity